MALKRLIFLHVQHRLVPSLWIARLVRVAAYRSKLRQAPTRPKPSRSVCVPPNHLYLYRSISGTIFRSRAKDNSNNAQRKRIS